MDTTLEIVILAMFATFIILRLISVLGRRPETDEPLAPKAESGMMRPRPAPAALAQPPRHPNREVASALEAIFALDPGFDQDRFSAGAASAYEMILTAYWQGDREGFKPFVSDEIFAIFDTAITEREAVRETLDNRLVGIDDVAITTAKLSGAMAEIAVAFKSRILNVRRAADGRVVDGDPELAVEGTDVWTFSRNLTLDDPNWLLIETGTE